MISPDVINPPLGQFAVKSCSTCAHDDLPGVAEPCANCSRNGGSYDKWEFVLMQKPGPKAPKAPKAAPTAITAPDILAAGAQHMRDRAATYDKPEGERSMAQTVKVFNAFHGTELTEAQGWHFMQVLKDVRLFTNKGYHADSAEDGVAYAGLKAEAKAKE